ncbi:hypothetical protein J4218_06540 [Candidatus Pacearchaeota archaeon]|nr:hypothetical protein [Candidatus Pacearchaeota archaeon]
MSKVASNPERISRYNSMNSRLGSEQALCVYLLAKSYSKSFASFSVNGSNPYREIADLTNRLWGEGNGGIKVNEKHVSSLLRHCSDEKLTMLNFLPSDLERYCQKCLKLDI